MRIPQMLKIGGKHYAVKITDNLSLGSSSYAGEINYAGLEIRIAPHPLEVMEESFIHEMIHGVMAHLGYTDHDEKKIEELAAALYMVIQDNPEVFLPRVEEASEGGATQ